MTHANRFCWLVLAALPLLAGLLWPGKSQASCGDYVHIGQQATAAQLPDSKDQAPAKPCHGPLCSSDRPAPPAVPLAPPVSSGDDLACPGILPTAPADPNDSARSTDCTTQPIHLPTDIYHPPR